MQTLCFALSFECGDFWLNRYQTLLVGLLAVFIAIRQVEIAKTQARTMTDQASQAKSFALIRVDEALLPLMRLLSMVTPGEETGKDADGWSQFVWDPVFNLPLVAKTPMDWDDASLAEAATRAFPKQAPTFVQLVKAARTLKGISTQYEAAPWDRHGPPEDRKPEMDAKTDAAFNTFFKYGNLCGPMQAHIRA